MAPILSLGACAGHKVGLDSDEIEPTLLSHKEEFRLCYENGIKVNSKDLGGRVTAHFVIGAKGDVTKSEIEKSTIENKAINNCIANVIKTIKFQPPSDGGTVQVTYPFKFSAAGEK